MSQATQTLTGTRLGGLLLENQIGVGGFGSVYRAKPDVGATRAVKVLHDRELAAALRREAETLLTLKHPRIVELIQADLSGDPPFVVMELLDGGSLADKIPMQPEKAHAVCRAILEGLANAHGKGIAHLDLKPQNILLGHDGEPKIADFGLARAVEKARGSLSNSQGATTGAGAGTLAYMAPEQREGKPGDLRSDMFTFGVLMTQILTAKLPQPGDTLDELLGRPAPTWATTLYNRTVCRYEKRYSMASEALAALEESSTAQVKPEPATTKSGNPPALIANDAAPRRSAVSDRLKPCPDCGTRISREAASCPQCGHVLPNQPVVGEQYLFNEDGVTVTRQRFVLPWQTYALAQVSSVRQVKESPKYGIPAFVLFIGVLWIFAREALAHIMSTAEGSQLALGILISVIGLGLSFVMKPRYIVLVVTSSGTNSVALSSKDRELVTRLVTALNDAIVARG